MARHAVPAMAVVMIGVIFASALHADNVDGFYLETRTCQVYTGPCFANGEMGLAGKDAIMAWSISNGRENGVDLSGLNVVLVLTASDTLGFRGIESAESVKSVVLVDERANSKQHQALIEFAKRHAGRAGKSVVRIDPAPIRMSIDLANLTGRLQAGDTVSLATRKARPNDCICSNEVAYYPPLAEVQNFAAGVTEQGEFSGRGLGKQWSTPGARSSYMATFRY